MSEKRLLHCCKPGPTVAMELMDPCPVPSMCMLPLGHPGRCEFTPNDEIVVELK